MGFFSILLKLVTSPSMPTSLGQRWEGNTSRYELHEPMKKALLAAAVFLGIAALEGQSTDNAGDPPVIAHPAPQPAQPEFNNDRILGVIPNYQTVEDPHTPYRPLAVQQKFKLFVRETVDPFTFVGAALGAGLSHLDNDDPRYGQGRGAYAERFGAAMADIATQNFFRDFVLASVLHEDPRYFRRGSEYPFFNRVGYALSRIVITRKDAGGKTFNFAGVGGMLLGIGLSDAYYPSRSVTAPEFGSRVTTSLLSAALSNLLPEFWPDIHEKVFHRHH